MQSFYSQNVMCFLLYFLLIYYYYDDNHVNILYFIILCIVVCMHSFCFFVIHEKQPYYSVVRIIFYIK